MRRSIFIVLALFAMVAVCNAADESKPLVKHLPDNDTAEGKALLKQLSGLKDRIVYESFRDTSFELIMMNADGSEPKNLTNTPDVNEIYAQASPDGRYIAFESYPATSATMVRIEVMRTDGTDRRVVVESGRQMAWSPDSSKLAYVVPDPEKKLAYQYNTDLSFYDINTKETTKWADGKDSIQLIDPSGKASTIKASELKNLLNLTWSADGKWVMASIVVTMGFSQSIVAVEVGGDRVIDILHMANETTGNILGCRPNISPDGKQVTWAVADVNKLMWIDIAPIDFDSAVPKVGDHEHLLMDKAPIELYHPDWSPATRYIAFSYGTRGNRMKPAFYVPGQKAPGWNICVVDSKNAGVYVQLTDDQYGNKEPEWVPAAN